jgi:hypothetical protein
MEYLKKSEGTKVKWYGNSEASTSASTYFTNTHDPVNQPLDQRSIDQFESVVNRLAELALVKDGNGWPVVEFMALRRCDKIYMVSYRFTSDWANSKYYKDVQQFGMGLGRGVFKPFSDKQDFDFYLGD